MLLCAATLYPDPKIYLGFTMCLMKNYQDIPKRGLIEDCALEHAIDFEELSDCANQDDGGYGVDMLRKSVARSSEVRGFTRFLPQLSSNRVTSRLVSQRAARSASTRRSTVFGMTASGRTAHTGLGSTTWF